jgi:D-aminopeptidase
LRTPKVSVELDEKKIDALFSPLNQCHLPGAVIGIAIGGEPVYRKAFGAASMELPILLSPSMRMRIYSTSKHFACLAYMLLCEDGRADIDDPLGKFLPELHPASRLVTMRQLMGHTSGLRDAYDIRCEFQDSDRALSSDEQLAFYREIDDANFAPGTNYCYNNGGFQLLSAAIERISGQSLEEVLRTRIFEPVEMYDSLLRRYNDDFVPNSAAMHSCNSAGQFCKSFPSGAMTGEGGIVSTVNDMLRWLAHMDAPVVGSAATWALMKNSQTLANGTLTGYGLGLKNQQYRGVATLYHAGGAPGANSQMLKVPAAGLDIVILLNRDDVFGMQLTEQILDICLPSLDPIKAPPERPIATGVFRSPATGRVIQLYAKDGRQMAAFEGLDLPVIADADGAFRPSGVRSFEQIAITPLADAEAPTAVRVLEYGNRDELKRVPAIDKPHMGTVLGRWRSDNIGIEATFSDTPQGPRLHTLGRLGSAEFNLKCLADGVWRATMAGAIPYGGIWSLGAEGQLRFSTCRNWGLKFRRIS